MKTIKYLVVSIVLTFTLSVCNHIYANNPPNPPGSHGSSNDEQPAGGGAPIGSGTALLIGLAAAYGGGKFLQKRKEDQNKE